MDAQRIAESEIAWAEKALTVAGIDPYLVDSAWTDFDEKSHLETRVCVAGRMVSLSGCSDVAVRVRSGLSKPTLDPDHLKRFEKYADKYNAERKEARAKMPAAISATQYEELLNRVAKLERKFGIPPPANIQ